MKRYDIQTVTLGTLLDDPEAVAIIEKSVPGAASHPMANLVRGMKAVDALQAAAVRLSDSQRSALITEIQAL